MCVIIHQPKGTHLGKKLAQLHWQINDDGGGFAFIDNEKQLQVYKSMSFNDYWSHFEQARSQFPNRDFLLHMRIQTHGATDIRNVHPFVLPDSQTVMAHNGILKGVPDDKSEQKRSDTRMFIDEVLPDLPENWLDRPWMVTMVEEWIGWSKLMFMSVNPALEKQVYILNEASGDMHEGMWFSNNHGLPSRKRQYSGWGNGMGGYDKNWWEADQRKTAAHIGRRISTPTHYGITETSAAADALKQQRDIDDVISLSKTDEALVHEFLMEERSESWLFAEIQFDGDDTWTCWGCDEEVHLLTGECECWIKECLTCNKLAAECGCEYSDRTGLKYAEARHCSQCHCLAESCICGPQNEEEKKLLVAVGKEQNEEVPF